MKKKFISTISFYFLLIGFAFGCTCAKGSYRFMDKIHKYPFLAMVEVIGKDTIRGKQVENPKSFNHSYDYAFTVVRIINQYSGKYLGKEIKIIDSKGYECFTRLRFKAIGDKFIVKGGIADINDHIYNDWDKQLPKEDILVLSLCDTNSLYVKGNEVSGWITANRNHRWWQWTTFLRKISFGLINRKNKRKEFEPQKMRVDEFRDLLIKRLEYSYNKR